MYDVEGDNKESLPETGNMFPEGLTGYLQRRCPDAGGSVGRKACFLACSSCELHFLLYCYVLSS